MLVVYICNLFALPSYAQNLQKSPSASHAKQNIDAQAARELQAYVDLEQIGSSCRTQVAGTPYENIVANIFPFSSITDKPVTIDSGALDDQAELERFKFDSIQTYANQTMYSWKKLESQLLGNQIYPNKTVELEKSATITASSKISDILLANDPAAKHYLLTDAQYAQEIKNFNAIVKELNQVCTDRHQEFSALNKIRSDKLQQDMELHPENLALVYPKGRLSIGDVASHVRDRMKEVREMGAQESSHRWKMLSQTRTGRLIQVSTPLQQVVGNWNPVSCVEQGLQLQTLPSNINALVTSSLRTVRTQYHQTIAELRANQSQSAEEVLESYITASPYAIASTLLAKPSRKRASQICQIILNFKTDKDVGEERMAWFSALSAVFTGGAVALSSSARGALMFSTTALAMSGYFLYSTVSDIQSAYRMKDLLDQALQSNQIDPVEGKVMVQSIQGSLPFSFLNLALAGAVTTGLSIKVGSIMKIQAYQRYLNVQGGATSRAWGQVKNPTPKVDGRSTNPFADQMGVKFTKPQPTGNNGGLTTQQLDDVLNWVNRTPPKPVTPQGGGTAVIQKTATATQPKIVLESKTPTVPSITNAVKQPPTIQQTPWWTPMLQYFGIAQTQPNPEANRQPNHLPPQRIHQPNRHRKQPRPTPPAKPTRNPNSTLEEEWKNEIQKITQPAQWLIPYKVPLIGDPEVLKQIEEEGDDSEEFAPVRRLGNVRMEFQSPKNSNETDLNADTRIFQAEELLGGASISEVARRIIQTNDFNKILSKEILDEIKRQARSDTRAQEWLAHYNSIGAESMGLLFGEKHKFTEDHLRYIHGLTHAENKSLALKAKQYLYLSTFQNKHSQLSTDRVQNPEDPIFETIKNRNLVNGFFRTFLRGQEQGRVEHLINLIDRQYQYAPHGSLDENGKFHFRSSYIQLFPERTLGQIAYQMDLTILMDDNRNVLIKVTPFYGLEERLYHLEDFILAMENSFKRNGLFNDQGLTGGFLADQRTSYSYLTVNNEAPGGYDFDEYDDVPRISSPTQPSPFSLSQAMDFANISPITSPLLNPLHSPNDPNSTSSSINNIINRGLPFDVTATVNSANLTEKERLALEVIEGKREFNLALMDTIESLAQRDDEIGEKARAYLDSLPTIYFDVDDVPETFELTSELILKMSLEDPARLRMLQGGPPPSPDEPSPLRVVPKDPKPFDPSGTTNAYQAPFSAAALPSSNPMEDERVAIEIIQGQRPLEPHLSNIIKKLGKRTDEIGKRARDYWARLHFEAFHYRSNYDELNEFLKNPGVLTDEVQKQLTSVCIDTEHPIFKEAKRFAFLSVLKNQYSQNYTELRHEGNKQDELKYWTDSLHEMNRLSMVKISNQEIQRIADYINKTFIFEKDWKFDEKKGLTSGATFGKMNARYSLINQKLTANIFFTWDDAGKLHFYFNDVQFFRFKSQMFPIEQLGRFHELIEDQGWSRSYDDVFQGKAFYLLRKAYDFKSQKIVVLQEPFRPFAELNFVRYAANANSRKFKFPPRPQSSTASETKSLDSSIHSTTGYDDAANPTLSTPKFTHVHDFTYPIMTPPAVRDASIEGIVEAINRGIPFSVIGIYKLPPPPQDDPFWISRESESKKPMWQLLQEALNGQITLAHKNALMSAISRCHHGQLSKEICGRVYDQFNLNHYNQLKKFSAEPAGFIQWWKTLRFISKDGTPLANPFSKEEIKLIYDAAKKDFDAAIEKDPVAKKFKPHMDQHMAHVDQFKNLIVSMGIDFEYYRLLVFLHDAGKYIPSKRVLDLASQKFTDPTQQFLHGRIVWHDQSTADYLIQLGQRLEIFAGQIEHLIKDIVGHNDGSGLKNIFWTDMFPNYPAPERLEGDLLAIFDRYGQGDFVGAAKILPDTRPKLFFDKVYDAYYINPKNTVEQLKVIYKRALQRIQERTGNNFEAEENLKEIVDYAISAQQKTIDAYSRLKWTPGGKACTIQFNGRTYAAIDVKTFLQPSFQRALMGEDYDPSANASSSPKTPPTDPALKPSNYFGDVKTSDLKLPIFSNRASPIDIMGLTNIHVGDLKTTEDAKKPKKDQSKQNKNTPLSIDQVAMNIINSKSFPPEATEEHRRKICSWYLNQNALSADFVRALESFIKLQPAGFCSGYLLSEGGSGGGMGTGFDLTTQEADENPIPSRDKIWWRTIFKKLGDSRFSHVQQLLLGSKTQELRVMDNLYACAIYGSSIGGIGKIAKTYIDSLGGYDLVCKKRLDQFVAGVPTGEQGTHSYQLISGIRDNRLRFLSAHQFKLLVDTSKDSGWLAAFTESWLQELMNFSTNVLGLETISYNTFFLGRNLSDIKDSRLAKTLWDIQVINEYSIEALLQYRGVPKELIQKCLKIGNIKGPTSFYAYHKEVGKLLNWYSLNELTQHPEIQKMEKGKTPYELLAFLNHTHSIWTLYLDFQFIQEHLHYPIKIQERFGVNLTPEISSAIRKWLQADASIESSTARRIEQNQTYQIIYHFFGGKKLDWPKPDHLRQDFQPTFSYSNLDEESAILLEKTQNLRSEHLESIDSAIRVIFHPFMYSQSHLPWIIRMAFDGSSHTIREKALSYLVENSVFSKSPVYPVSTSPIPWDPQKHLDHNLETLRVTLRKLDTGSYKTWNSWVDLARNDPSLLQQLNYIMREMQSMTHLYERQAYMRQIIENRDNLYSPIDNKFDLDRLKQNQSLHKLSEKQLSQLKDKLLSNRREILDSRDDKEDIILFYNSDNDLKAKIARFSNLQKSLFDLAPQWNETRMDLDGMIYVPGMDQYNNTHVIRFLHPQFWDIQKALDSLGAKLGNFDNFARLLELSEILAEKMRAKAINGQKGNPIKLESSEVLSLKEYQNIILRLFSIAWSTKSLTLTTVTSASHSESRTNYEQLYDSLTKLQIDPADISMTLLVLQELHFFKDPNWIMKKITDLLHSVSKHSIGPEASLIRRVNVNFFESLNHREIELYQVLKNTYIQDSKRLSDFLFQLSMMSFKPSKKTDAYVRQFLNSNGKDIRTPTMIQDIKNVSKVYRGLLKDLTSQETQELRTLLSKYSTKIKDSTYEYVFKAPYNNHLVHLDITQAKKGRFDLGENSSASGEFVWIPALDRSTQELLGYFQIKTKPSKSYPISLVNRPEIHHTAQQHEMLAIKYYIDTSVRPSSVPVQISVQSLNENLKNKNNSLYDRMNQSIFDTFMELLDRYDTQHENIRTVLTIATEDVFGIDPEQFKLDQNGSGDDDIIRSYTTKKMTLGYESLEKFRRQMKQLDNPVRIFVRKVAAAAPIQEEWMLPAGHKFTVDGIEQFDNFEFIFLTER